MRSIAFYKRLRDMGMDEASALLAAEAFEQEVSFAVEQAVQKALEPRRAKDRERKRLPRNSAESVESAEFQGTPPKQKVSPTPPPKTHTPMSPPYSPPTKSDLEELAGRIWALQPKLDGKRRQTRPDVQRALATALRHGTAAEIEAACSAYYALPASLKDGGAYAMGAGRLLTNERWREFLPGSEPAETMRQLVPPFPEAAIRSAVAALKGEPWTASWLDPCAWEAERRVIVPRTGFAAQKLVTDVGRVLREAAATVERAA